jgi:hypothetical protein
VESCAYRSQPRDRWRSHGPWTQDASCCPISATAPPRQTGQRREPRSLLHSSGSNVMTTLPFLRPVSTWR